MPHHREDGVVSPPPISSLQPPVLPGAAERQNHYDFLSNICIRFDSEIRPGEVGVDLGTGEIGGQISFAASYNEGPCSGGGEGLGEVPVQVSGGISGRELTFVISAEGDSITFVATRQ
jgi:hypothetical protein